MARVRSAAGFSIIEVLIASTVFISGVLTLAQAFAAAEMAQARARQLTAATIAAAQKLEELRGAPFDALAGGRDARGGLTRVWSVVPVAGTDAMRLAVEAAPGSVALATVRARVVP